MISMSYSADQMFDVNAGSACNDIILSGCNRKRALICDDEVMIVHLFNMVLSSAMPDVEIDTSYNGKEALEKFIAGRHAVLVMDLHMPVMDGNTSFIKIQEACRANNWEIPSFVFCSGFAPPGELRRTVEKSNIHCLLPKPVTNQAIIKAVQSRLNAHRHN